MASLMAAAALLAFAFACLIKACTASQIGIRARLLASDQGKTWISDNGTFAFGFSPTSGGSSMATDRFVLAVWFAELPGDRTLIWSANRLVSKI